MRYAMVLARVAFGFFVIAALIGLAASAGTRLGLWNFRAGMNMLIPAVFIGAIGFVAGLVWLIGALRGNSSVGARLGFTGLIGAAVFLYFPLSAEYRGLTLPPMHDVTTDPEHAPKFVDLLPLRQGATNTPNYNGGQRVMYRGQMMTMAYMQHKYYPELAKPMALLEPRDRLYWHAFETAKAMGWHVLTPGAAAKAAGRIEATDTSFWFGEISDIVIRVKQAGTLGARLDIRSESRNGDTDDGDNAARIKAYMKAL